MALKELPEKDKKLILPIFPIKSWTTAKELSSSISRVEESIGEGNKWIADIDYDDVLSRPEDKYRDVHFDILKLINPVDGYRNWCDFVTAHPSIIPCLQFGDLAELSTQFNVLESLGRGLVAIFRRSDLENPKRLINILNEIENASDILVIIDLGHITREQIELKAQIEQYIEAIKSKLPSALVSVSSSSFPDSFSGYYKGTITIYERALFDKLRLRFEDLVYSDRGGARAVKLSGGGGTPPPRIDYSCRNEWHFIRAEVERKRSSQGTAEIRRLERRELYTELAKELMSEDFWEEDLKLWSNYIIELTAKDDDFGINSAQKATAVRINKHLYTQLHYDNVGDAEDTDEDWVD